MIHLNEKNLGDRVTRCEINAAIATLQAKGYACEYGPHTPGAAQQVSPAHWRQAVAAAHKAAATAPAVRNLEDLPLSEQCETLQAICAFLGDKLADYLFSEAVSA